MDEITLNIEQEIENPIKVSYKMLALRGLVVFPGQSIHFDLGRDKSTLALNKALETNQDIFLVAQKHSTNINPAPKDIYRVGTLSKIKQVIKMPNESMRVLVSGIERMEIESYVSITPYFEVTLKPYQTEEEDPLLTEAMKRKLNEQLEEYKKLEHKIPTEIINNLSLDNIPKFISVIVPSVFNNEADRQKILQEKSVYNQMMSICIKLASECDIMALEKKISNKVNKNIAQSQREYYIREQIKVLHEELGENEDEVAEYNIKIKELEAPEYVKQKLEKELVRLQKMSPTSPEAGVIRTYMDWIIDLPWLKQSTDNTNLVEARKILDEDHYGLEKVKERIVEYLAVHQLTNSLKSPILCFVGPPGVGKTSIVASIARAIDRELIAMSLGGVRDEAEIRGHRRTYIGALPGRIVSAMKKAGVVNPVFLLDEIDKMSSDFRGDPASAMLEVLDPNQNYSFTDHYLEMPYDLSKIMFVTTANTLESIPLPLLDRMEIIELTGYTYEEKLQIAKKYLLPKQIKANGLKEDTVKISDDVIMKIISQYTRESGVRNLEREIATLARKIAVKIVNSKSDLEQYFTVNSEDLSEYLGIPKHADKAMNETDEVGLATGLAWTYTGGVTLNIEVALIPDGKGEITLTGSLGDVMKESCQTALTLVRTRAIEYNIPLDKFTKYDIHIHIPEGATPKDGPSAGITLATAILSALSNRKVDRNVAMTGEVTLRGKVLAIGGLKEKSLAAFRSGIRKLIIPCDNKKDLVDIPPEVKNSMKIICADNIDTVFQNALV